MLGDICQIAMGQSPSSDTYTMNKAGVPFFQGNADFGEENPIPRIWCNKPIKIANENDILISVRAPIGSINIANRKCCIGRGLAKITPNICVYLRYLIWFLRSRTKFLQDNGTGTTFKAINKKQLETLPISLPNVNEQMQIGQVLDKLSSLINLKKKQYRVLDKLVKSQFIETFGDPVINNKELPVRLLGDISLIKTGPFGSLLHKEDYENSNHFLVNPQHIFRDSIHCKSGESISDKKFHQLTAYHLLPGDIVLARRGEMGRCAVVKSVGLICGTGSLIIRVNKSILLPQVIQLMISLPSYRKFIQSRSVGATLENINAKITSALPVIVPKLNIQTTFMKKIDQLNKSKFVIQQSIEKLELLKKSLMQQYFG